MAQITFRCTDAEKKVWSELAKKDRRSLGDWIRLQIADASLLRGLRQSERGEVREMDFTRVEMPPEATRSMLADIQEIANKEPIEPQSGYNFSKMEVVKRGPGRKPPMLDPKVRVRSDIVEEGSAIVKLIAKGCDHKSFKRKDGLVVCEDCGVRL